MDPASYLQAIEAGQEVVVYKGFFGALLGAIAPALIGGLINRRSAREQQQASYAQTEGGRRQDRKWFEKDRLSERAYVNRQTANDRRYAEITTARDRQYARSVLTDERDYQEGISDRDRRRFLKDKAADRRKFEIDRAGDRQYMEDRQNDDRAYLDGRRKEDRAQFRSDQRQNQINQNRMAEKTAASRGVDFTKLRDDAIAAGYNPMTALSMAHAYSTEVNYSAPQEVWNGGAAYNASGYNGPVGGTTGGIQSPSGGGGGGGSVGGTPVMGGSLAAGGGFQAAGSGYSSQFNPALSAGSFVQEAMERGVDTWFNRPEPQDKLATALRGALSQKQEIDTAQSENIQQSFGYDLTQQEEYKPALSVGVPALMQDKVSVAPNEPLRPPSSSRERWIEVVTPRGDTVDMNKNVADRAGIKHGDTLTAGDMTELFGEVAEVEAAINQGQLRDTLFNLKRPFEEWGVGTDTRDYIESGITGSPIMRQRATPGWMDRMYGY